MDLLIPCKKRQCFFSLGGRASRCTPFCAHTHLFAPCLAEESQRATGESLCARVPALGRDGPRTPRVPVYPPTLGRDSLTDALGAHVPTRPGQGWRTEALLVWGRLTSPRPGLCPPAVLGVGWAGQRPRMHAHGPSL